MKNKTIITAGIFLIILWIILAAITFDKTFTPIKSYLNNNPKIISVFILGTLFIVILGILVIYYLNKFFEETKKGEQRFKTMFDNNPVMHFIMDIETGKIIDANKAAEKFYGYSKKELASMKITDIALMDKNEDRQFRLDVFNKGAENPTVKILSHKLKNDEIKRVEITLSPIEIDGKIYLINSIKDITEKILYENELLESADFFKTLTENLISGIVLYNEKYIYVNPEGEKILGYPRKELYQKYAWDIYAGESAREMIKSSIAKRLAGEIFNSNYTLKITTKQNTEKWLFISASTVKYKGKHTALASFMDITELNNLKESLENERNVLKIITDNVPAIIGLYRENPIYLNPYGMQILGYSQQEISELSIVDLIDARQSDKAVISNNIKRRLSGENFDEKYTLKVKKKNGETFWGRILATTIYFENKWTGLIIISDISESILKELELLKEKNKFQELAELDDLTQIPNRRSFDEKLNRYLKSSDLKTSKFSLIMFDIDKFKQINDTFGHQAGDSVLSELASLVSKNIRKDDFFARFGGEEFMVILPYADIKKAAELAEKLRLKIEKHNFLLQSKITCSLGVTQNKPDDTEDSIIYRADIALYKAKESGRNKVEIFT